MSAYIPYIIVAIAAAVAATYISRKVRRLKYRVNSQIRNLTSGAALLSRVAEELSNEGVMPEQKTVSGATNLYLPKVEKDFADFHEEEAVVAVSEFVKQYIDIKYQVRSNFSGLKVDSGVLATIDKQPRSSIGEKIIHKVAIKNYEKTNEYATITYHVSVGYNVEGEQKEERYIIKYTLKLREHGLEKAVLVCDNCGATLDSTAVEVCPYCGTRIVRDTKMSWMFTYIQQD